MASRISWMPNEKRQRLLGLLLLKQQEEEQRELAIHRRWWIRPLFQERRKKGCLFRNVDVMRERDPELFCNFLRMTPDQFDYVLHLIHDDIAPSECSVREPIAAKDRLAVVLRYLASGDSMTSLSYSCGISVSSISNFIPLVCEALWLRLLPIVMPVPTTEKWREVAEEMDEYWQFPHCVGAIDGKHVVMQAPPNAGSLFFNYKGSHSIVLLAVCDAKYKFLLVDIGGSGRNSDGGILSASNFGKAMDAGTLGLPPPSTIDGIRVPMPYVFVGDAAFPLKDYLMRPFPGQHLEYEKRIFNYRLSRVRRLIENTFGIMSARFRVFRGPIHAEVETVCSITKAAVCLHNFLLEADQALPDEKKTYCPPMYHDTEDEDRDIIRGAWRRLVNGFVNLSLSAFNFSRRSGAYSEWFSFYFNYPGTVYWQRDKV